MNGTLMDFTYPVAPGWTDPDTGKAAAESVADRVHILRSRCLKVIEAKPSTADEVAAALGESVLSIRPRCTELFQLGKIKDSGARRANVSGRKAKVWRTNAVGE